MVNWFELCSGSDIRGTAIEGVLGQNVNLTDEVIEGITNAFVVFMKNKTGKKALRISVGRDSRLSGERIESCVINTCLKRGADIFKCGLASTPAMFMTTKDNNLKCDCAIQITASHHPFNKNGLKFFDENGGLEHNEILQILELASKLSKTQLDGGSLTEVDFMQTYSDSLINKVITSTNNKKPLSGMKIIVDAGNGVGGFYEKVLSALGADTTGSQFLEPDGNFPNHIPNPENEAAMKSISDAVINNQADYGIIFDTDVDRAGMVDSTGQEINRNTLIAVISKILLDEKKGATIVTDSITSTGLNKFIKDNGGIHHRFKRGYKNVINESIRLNEQGIYSPLAIETSGHAALKENFFLDDGAYLVTRILITIAKLNLEGKKLNSLIENLETAKASKEIRLTFYESDFFNYGSKFIESLITEINNDENCKLAESNFEGARGEFENGWFLARMSVHDPIMPINIESDSEENNKKIAEWLYSKIKPYRGINSQNLLDYINN